MTLRTDALVTELAILGMLLAAGATLGLLNRRRFRPGWLLAAAGLHLLNDALLTRGYGLLPRLLPRGDWNWQGNLLALAATLLVAALPLFGWRNAGITPVQRPGSIRAILPVVILYCAFFTALAFALPAGRGDAEAWAFQLTLPGLEEETFFRGLLLLALDRAFLGRFTFLGVKWGWGALLSSALFGLAHAFDFGDGAFSFDATVMAATALPSLVGVWVRYRTGSVLVPVLIHNFGNSIGLLLAEFR